MCWVLGLQQRISQSSDLLTPGWWGPHGRSHMSTRHCFQQLRELELPASSFQLTKFRLKRVQNVRQDSNPLSSGPYSLSNFTSAEISYFAVSWFLAFCQVNSCINVSDWPLACPGALRQRDRGREMVRGECGKKIWTCGHRNPGSREDLAEKKWR